MKAKAPGLRLRLPWSGHLGPLQPPVPENRPLWAARAAPRAGGHGLLGCESRRRTRVLPAASWPRETEASSRPGCQWPGQLASLRTVRPRAPPGHHLCGRPGVWSTQGGCSRPDVAAQSRTHGWSPRRCTGARASCPLLRLKRPRGVSVGGHHGCSRGTHSRWQCPQCPRVVGGGEQEAGGVGLPR